MPAMFVIDPVQGLPLRSLQKLPLKIVAKIAVTAYNTIAEEMRALGQKEKLEKRLLSYPNDFTFDEMVKLLGYYGLEQRAGGKTGGSRVRFENADKSFTIMFHRPHNPNTFKQYVIREVIDDLKREGYLHA